MLSYDIINGEQEGAFTKQEYCQDSPAGFLYRILRIHPHTTTI